MIDSVLGIAKAYCTRVGEGPFPTEMLGELGDEVRKKGHEFGTVTGRARRCGWFDVVAMKRAIRTSGIDSIILTKLDVLSGLPTLKLGTGYKRGDELVDDLPPSSEDYEGLEAVYFEVPGWAEDISGVRTWEGLPKTVHGFVETLTRLLECPVLFVSVGPGREATIPVAPPAVVKEFLA
jgi:adenylosuccinate synthase